MKDIFGVEIELGDYVVYASKVGDSSVMKHGKVLEFRELKDYRGIVQSQVKIGERREDDRDFFGNPDKDSWLEKIGNIVVVEKAMNKERVLGKTLVEILAEERDRKVFMIDRKYLPISEEEWEEGNYYDG